MAQKGKQHRGGMHTTFTGISPLTIHDVNGHTGSPLTISDPFPWTVTGTVGFTAPATGIAAMAYQVNDGPVNGFAPPTFTGGVTSGNYTFQLNADDIPANGQFALTVYAWDNSANNASATIDFVIVFVAMAVTPGAVTGG